MDELTETSKYVLTGLMSALAGSGIVSAVIQWLWGRVMSEIRQEADAKHAELNTKLATLETQVNAICQALNLGTSRFSKIEEDINKTNFDILAKVSGMAEKSAEYREQASREYIRKDQLEGEIIKVASKYCREHCHKS
jgi:chaperonin cofactor prefoldin